MREQAAEVGAYVVMVGLGLAVGVELGLIGWATLEAVKWIARYFR